MAKKPQAYRRIGEVADWLGVPTSTVRYWTSRFKQIRPVQRAGGRRYYRVEDLVLLGGIRTLLHDHGYSIDDLRQEMKLNGVAFVASQSLPLPDGVEPPETIEMRADVMPFARPDRAEETDEAQEEESGLVARVAGGGASGMSRPGPSMSGTGGGDRSDSPQQETAGEAAEPAPAEPAAAETHDEPAATAPSPEEAGPGDSAEAGIAASEAAAPSPDVSEDDSTDDASDADEAAAAEAEPQEPKRADSHDLARPLPSVEGAETDAAGARSAGPARRRKRAGAEVSSLLAELEALRERMGR